jgi:hypothetical protein
MIGLGLVIPFGVFALAISPAKGRTLKRMALVFITVSPSIVVLGILAAEVFQSHLIARSTGLLSSDGVMPGRSGSANLATPRSQFLDEKSSAARRWLLCEHF